MTSRIALSLLLALVLAACSSTEVVTTAPPSTPPAMEEPEMTDNAMMDEMEGAMEEMAGLTAPMLLDPDTVQAGRFDNGRMFTFDNPPRAYLAETYGFSPGDEWFEQAHLAALRFATYCSSSFVSPDGLILTNHHCARQSITQVTAEGEDLGADGFYAEQLGDERLVDGLFVEQLIEITDVTAEVEAAAEGMETDAERINARREAIDAIQERMEGEAGGEDAGMRVQIITLYNGGQYSAYTFRRYDDVRLVFAPEDELGFFGGDPDNFTYPRYSLDFALFRAYDDNGDPVDTSGFFFPWSADGTDEGELVFVIGNPGSTTRLQTVAQLEYRRDVQEPATLRLLSTRADVYERFVDMNPDAPETPEIEDTYFSLSNGRKAYTGRVEGLQDPYVIARRAAAERAFRQEVETDAQLRADYGDLFDQIAQNRQEAKQFAAEFGAFIGMNPGSSVASNTLTRALNAHAFATTQNDQFRGAALRVEEDRPADLERMLVEARLADFVHYLGADSDLVEAVLQGRSVEQAARDIFSGSAFATHAGTEAALEGDLMASDDPALAVAAAIWPSYIEFQQQNGVLGAQVGELAGELARARFEVYGTEIPPDATFSLRINDGRVQGYDYNGTVAPPYTSFYGLYDRHFAFQADDEHSQFYSLPDRWLPIPGDLDLTTPYNFVTTNDIIGGNSGSPMLNRDLEVVGVAFDGNIQSLPGDYIYLPQQNRTVGVDSRAMLEVLETVYDAERVAEELRSGKMTAR
ncbi:MAG: S46 family peptidase [Bacteroidota bacterium]